MRERSELITCNHCNKYKLQNEMWSSRVCIDCKPILEYKLFEYETKKAKECQLN